MNQEKIGKFIASLRKEKAMTQSELAEKLNITDRAVSKWERGKGMPDSSSMISLCNHLGITVDELLYGERINDNNEKTKQVFLEITKEVEEKNKIIWSCMWIIMTISIISLLAGTILAAFLIPEGIWQGLAIFGICVVFLLPCFYALKLEVSVGAYKCKKCGKEIVPTYLEALSAMHRGTTRYLKCPDCKRRTWCKKILRREENI